MLNSKQMNTEVIDLKELSRRINVEQAAFRDHLKLNKITKGVIYSNGYPKMIYEIAKAKKGVFAPEMIIVMNLEFDLN